MNFNNIKFTYRMADIQKDLFTPQHELYKVTIKTVLGQYTTNFQCNFKNKPTLKDVLYCLYMDSTSLDYVNSDVWNFSTEYGYKIESKEDYNKVKKIIAACKRTDKALKRIFTENELNELADFCNEY